MNIRIQLAALSSFCLLAACTHSPSQKPHDQTATGQSQSVIRQTASAPPLTREKAMQYLSNGVPFGITCALPEGSKNSKLDVVVGFDFYVQGENNSPATESYLGTYPQIASMLRNANSMTNLNGKQNRIINSAGHKYWITPYSIYYDDRNDPNRTGDNGATVGTIRSDLYSTCQGWANELTASGFYIDASYVPLSIVGPYISYQYTTSSFTGGAHPNLYMAFESRNVTYTSIKDASTRYAEKKFNLFELSSEADILAALKKDKYLQKKVGKTKLEKAVNTSAVHQLMNEALDGDCEISIPDDKNEAFSQLAIYDYDATKNIMQVRVGYSYGCEAARGNFTQLGLALTPNENFAQHLRAEVASATEQGRKPYFMRYSKQLR